MGRRSEGVAVSAVGLAVRAAAVSALGFTLVPVLGANPAMACSCIQSTEQENYERADVVFKGTMDDARATNDQFGERVFVFTPSTIYKGKAAKPQKVSTAGNSSACGADLTGGGPFLVFAAKADGAKAGLSTSLCSGTREIGTDEKPDFKAHGDTSDGRMYKGGGDPVSPPCCKPLVGEPGAEPAPDAVPDNEAGGPVVAPTSVDAPLMQTTGMATDSASPGATTAEDGPNLLVTGTAGLVGLGALAALGFATARRRRSA